MGLPAFHFSRSFSITLEESINDPDIDKLPQIKRLRHLKEYWRRDKLEVPSEWIPTNEDCSSWRKDALLFPIRTLYVYANPIVDVLSGLSAEEMLRRHDDKEFMGPDFLLQSYRIKMGYYTVSFCLNPRPSAVLFGTIFNYFGEEAQATISLAETATDVAGCWVVVDPTFQQIGFDEPTTTHKSDSISFAVMAIGHHPSPKLFKRHRMLSVIYTRPALLVGILGPSGWPPHRRYGERQDISMDEIETEVETCLRFSLLSLISSSNSQLSEATPLDSLVFEPWTMIMGIVYDAHRITLKAYIPTVMDSKLVLIKATIDSFDFECEYEASPPFAEWSLERWRLCISLLTLQRHCFLVSNEVMSRKRPKFMELRAKSIEGRLLADDIDQLEWVSSSKPRSYDTGSRRNEDDSDESEPESPDEEEYVIELRKNAAKMDFKWFWRRTRKLASLEEMEDEPVDLAAEIKGLNFD